MNTRRIIMLGLVFLVLLGLGNFIVGSVLTRSQLSMVASRDPAAEKEGVQRLHARGILFDALQGGAPLDTRLNAITALSALAADGKHKEYFSELLQMLKDPDTESAEAKTHPVRDAATAAVAKIGIAYPDILMDAAKDQDGNIKTQSQAALKTIGKPLMTQLASRLGDSALRNPFGDVLSTFGPDSIPLIAPYLKPPLLKTDAKPDDLVTTKVDLIGILGKFNATEAAEPILPFASDPNLNVRRAVVTALANIGSPVGAGVLIEALRDTGTDPSARSAAAAALGAIATPEANAAMTVALRDYDLSVANAAASGLKRAGDAAQSSIAAALADPDRAVRARAAAAAGGLSSTALSVKALADADPDVRAVAAQSVGDILFRELTVQTDLARLAHAVTPADQRAALDAVQKQGATPELLSSGAPLAARANALAAVTALIAAETDATKRETLESLRSRLAAAPETQSAVYKNLTVVTDASVAPLITALSDSDGAVAQAATISLGRLGEIATSSLVAALGSANETVAYYASRALTTIGSAAVGPVISAAQMGKPSARWAAVTLGQIGDPRAAPALTALIGSVDPDTAYVAKTALAKVRPG